MRYTNGSQIQTIPAAEAVTPAAAKVRAVTIPILAAAKKTTPAARTRAPASVATGMIQQAGKCDLVLQDLQI